MNTTRTYTEKEMVEFGQYLLSNDRKVKFEEAYLTNDNISLEERLSQVYDADLKNFFGINESELILIEMRKINEKIEKYLNRYGVE